MPRSPRIEYTGAVYHVMCRGDHREAIFKGDEDRRLFIETLGQVCERTGWRIHGYVLMPNHYHLLLETPNGGLVDGMRWFQTTYTARFNARHRLCGHLFQGRYKAIMVDSDEPSYFRTLSDYIHLNPVRARLLKTAPVRLEGFPWSSYPAYIGKAKRPSWLEIRRVLESCGLTRPGYRRYMQGRVLEVRGGGEALAGEWKSIRRGWVLGGEAFREKMLERIGERMESRKRESYSGEEVKGHDRKRAEELLRKGLRALKIEQGEIQGIKTTDERKQALTWLIRSSTQVSCEWICEQLGLGHRSNISRAVRALESPGRTYDRLKAIMLQCKD
jgi:REP element-mobilizing transposase RayT